MALTEPQAMSPRAAEPTPKRLEVPLTSACAQRCVFCAKAQAMAGAPGREPSAAALGQALLEKRVQGFDEVELTGGEPTEHSAFVAVLAAAKRLGYRTIVSTNGQRLAEPVFAAQALPYVDELAVSVHADHEALHDALTGTPGSFAAALETLARGAEREGRVLLAANIVVCAANVDRVVAALRMLLERPGVRRCTLVNVAPEGRASAAYESLAVPHERWEPLAAQARELADATDAQVWFSGVPLCALGSHLALSSDLYAKPSVRLEQDERGKLVARKGSGWPQKRRGRSAACARCAGKALCGGVYERGAAGRAPAVRPLTDLPRS